MPAPESQNDIACTAEPPVLRRRQLFSRKHVLTALAVITLCVVGITGFLRRYYLLRFWHDFADYVVNWTPFRVPPLFLGVLTVMGVLALILLVWKLPRWQVARSEALTDDNRFDRENEARKTLAQILAGAFVLGGLYASVQTLELSREGQITDRFTRAIEQLGTLDLPDKRNSKLEVRLGGIYALERIARDSEKDHPVIMEVLTTYVRTHASIPRSDQNHQNDKCGSDRDATPLLQRQPETHPSPDIQAILTVLGRRRADFDRDRLNLAHMDLTGVDLKDAQLGGVDLRGANLTDAVLAG